MPDSVKTILLSTNDTLLLSKDHGMLQMPELRDTKRFELIGLQSAHLGFMLPTWRVIYEFNVGDSFFYLSVSAESGNPFSSANYLKHEKIFILSKAVTDTFISYDVKWIGKTEIPLAAPPYSIVYGGIGFFTLTYRNDSYNYYNESIYNFKFIPSPSGSNKGTIQKVKPYNERIEITYHDNITFYFLEDSIILLPGPVYEVRNYYITGMGNIDRGEYSGLSYSEYKSLICYNGVDTFNLIGETCSDFYAITSIENIPFDNISVEYNNNNITITNLSGLSVNYLLFDNMGKMICSGNSKEENFKIDIASLSSGLSFLKTSIDSNSLLRKVLI